MIVRDILFKAKEIESGKWVYGYYKKVYDMHFIDNPGSDGCFYQHIVDKNTICQYTGLTDKDGNKIWENDIVCTPYVDPVFGDMVNDKILDDYTWKVVFVDGGFCVENEDKIINLRSFTNGNHIKVIGNIFDNPELLKGE